MNHSFHRMADYIQRRHRAGFTLIELAVVLVIVGLIAGGVLVGKEIISASEVRAHISEMEALDTSLNAFRLKYNCLAGDCNKTSMFGLNQGCPAFSVAYQGGIGNGNNTLDDAEKLLVFCNLFKAELSRYSSSAGGPFTASGNGVTVNCWEVSCANIPSAVGSNRQISVLGFYAPFHGASSATYNKFHFFLTKSNNISLQNSYSPTELFQMDSKADDGLPTSGKIQAFNENNAVAPTVGAAGSANCVSNAATPNSYNITNNTRLCVPGFKLGGYW